LTLRTARPIHQEGRPVLVGAWKTDEDFAVHPVGSKPKRMLTCPPGVDHPCLIPGHSYLFKTARGWRANQLWSEVIAYQLGALTGVDVPPCFLAVNETSGEVGALIEFFYGYPGEKDPARLIHGADVLRRFRPMITSERPHGVRTNVTICRAFQIRECVEWWGQVLTFDALIGNTDRHTENWGLLVHRQGGERPKFSLAPPFDNGTSLGYEQPEQRLLAACEPGAISTYIDRGRHHCGWDLADDQPAPHMALCGRFAAAYPEARGTMTAVLNFSEAEAAETLKRCVEFDVGIPFSEDRVRFVLELLMARRSRLLAVLGGDLGKLD
jgi:hypothetical protein